MAEFEFDIPESVNSISFHARRVGEWRDWELILTFNGQDAISFRVGDAISNLDEQEIWNNELHNYLELKGFVETRGPGTYNPYRRALPFEAAL